MSELITLHGGPAGGRLIEWRGGDFLALYADDVPPIGMVPCVTGGPSYDIAAPMLYRRSYRSQSAFVFQP